MSIMGKLVYDESTGKLAYDDSTGKLIYADTLKMTLGDEALDASFDKQGGSVVSWADAVTDMETRDWRKSIPILTPRAYSQNLSDIEFFAQYACGRFDIASRDEVGSILTKVKVDITTLFGDAATWRLAIVTNNTGTPDPDYTWFTGAAAQVTGAGTGLQTLTLPVAVTLQNYMFLIFGWQTYVDPGNDGVPDSTDVALAITGVFDV